MSAQYGGDENIYNKKSNINVWKFLFNLKFIKWNSLLFFFYPHLFHKPFISKNEIFSSRREWNTIQVEGVDTHAFCKNVGKSSKKKKIPHNVCILSVGSQSFSIHYVSQDLKKKEKIKIVSYIQILQIKKKKKNSLFIHISYMCFLLSRPDCTRSVIVLRQQVDGG